MAFTCEKCGVTDQDMVYDTRRTKDWIIRRRKCTHCGMKFTTYEVNLPKMRETYQRYIRRELLRSINNILPPQSGE